MSNFIGFTGVFLGLFVAPVQLISILRTKETRGISLYTYIFLCLALACYLYHAIKIGDPVFITAQSINLVTNLVVLGLLIKYRR